MKAKYDALDDGYALTHGHYTLDGSTNPPTHRIDIVRLKESPKFIRKSGYYPLMDIEEQDTVVCLM